MEDTSWIGIGLIVLIFWALILQWIIASASKTKERLEIEKVQLKILVDIACKLGVTDEELQKV